MIRAVVGAGWISVGEVCPDDEKHGHQHPETAAGASPAGKRSALPTRVEVQFAIETPNSYSDGRNCWSSGRCRVIGFDIDSFYSAAAAIIGAVIFEGALSPILPPQNAMTSTGRGSTSLWTGRQMRSSNLIG